jgi:hypothetical protein
MWPLWVERSAQFVQPSPRSVREALNSSNIRFACHKPVRLVADLQTHSSALRSVIFSLKFVTVELKGCFAAVSTERLR